jgi:hypothetical protein
MPIRKGSGEARQDLPREWRDLMKQTMLVGTIHGAFDGALDGMPARLIRTRKFGFTVELLASKDEFHKEDRVDLSIAEFTINKGETNEL